MRKFYCFKIKEDYYKLVNNRPKELYLIIHNLYHPEEYKINPAINFIKEIRVPFNKEILNDNLYNYYQDKYNYIKVNNTHQINDYFTKERSSLTVYNNFLLIETNTNFPTFLKHISKKEKIFVVDFKNQDYFWLHEYK